MICSTKVLILSENTVRRKGLIAEHGISFWIERGGKKVLFDTGQGMALPHNIRSLGIPLSKADAIVLSHGHYDHVGGLEFAAKQTRSLIYAHPAAFQRKYLKYMSGKIGKVSVSFLDNGGKKRLSRRLRWTTGATEIIKGIFVTGEVPRKTDFEDTGGAFYLDKKLKKVDSILDDQALYFKSQKGWVVLLGCAHAGVVNTLDYIQELTGGPIYAVIGGMHLIHADKTRMQRTAQAFRRLKLKKIGAGHCTGEKGIHFLQKAFPKEFFFCSTGLKMDFN